MKKLILSLFAIVFLLVFKPSFAQTPADSTSTPQETVEYQLPYPGILPDSPLYSLKTLRDKIVEFLISDPLKKAEFDLLSSDKKISTGLYLFNKYHEKEDLVYSTIFDGENYFEKAIADSQMAKKQGINTDSILNKMLLAAKKHQEIIGELEEKVASDKKQNFVNLEKRVAGFEKKVHDLGAR